MPKELKRDRALFRFIDAEQFLRRAVSLGRKQIALCAHHFADCHRTAHFMADDAKRHIRHARHRRKHRALLQKIEIHISSAGNARGFASNLTFPYFEIACKLEMSHFPAVRTSVTR